MYSPLWGREPAFLWSSLLIAKDMFPFAKDMFPSSLLLIQVCGFMSRRSSLDHAAQDGLDFAGNSVKE